MNSPTTDTIIVGAGPIGLEMAVALKEAHVDYLQFDAGQIGQTISWYPQQTQFFSSPDRISLCGVPLHTPDQNKATGEQYLAYLRSLVEQFDLKVKTYEPVTQLSKKDDLFHVITSKGNYTSKHLILTIGDMHKPRMLGVPGEKLPHVSHYFEEPHRYFQQRLLVVGGKNSAVEAALRCQRAGAIVSISYRQDQFNERSIKYWLKPEIDWLIQTQKITFYPSSTVTEITPMHVQLQTTEGAAKVPADFVLLMTGYEMDPFLLKQAGVLLHGKNQAPEVDFNTMQTQVPGLFVAGTAAAGTQIRFRLFIENSHSHVVKILRTIAGCDPKHINPLAYTRLNENPIEEDLKTER